MRRCGGELDYKAGAVGLRLITQVAAERAHEGARKVKPEPGSMRLLLEGPEEPVGMRDAAAGIADAH